MFREFVAAKRKAEDEQLAAVAQAWQSAAFFAEAQAGKLRQWDDVVVQIQMARIRLSPSQQHARVIALGAHLGVAVRPISESTKRALLRLRES